MRFGHWRGVMLAVALISSMATDPVGLRRWVPLHDSPGDPGPGPEHGPALLSPRRSPGATTPRMAFRSLLPQALRNLRAFRQGPGLCGGHGLFGKGGKRLRQAGLRSLRRSVPPRRRWLRRPWLRVTASGSRIAALKGKGCGLCKSSRAAASAGPRPASSQSAPAAGRRDLSASRCRCPRRRLHRAWLQARQGASPGGDGDLCGACGGKGCGLCGGLGRLFGHRRVATSAMLRRQGLRPLRRTRQECSASAAARAAGLRLRPEGQALGLLHPHAGDIKYFVGPGGPVPLTPGYVPYVIPTRSPRDFLAFPPYTPDGF